MRFVFGVLIAALFVGTPAFAKSAKQSDIKRKIAQQPQQSVPETLLASIRNNADRSKTLLQAWSTMVPNVPFRKDAINCEFVTAEPNYSAQRNQQRAGVRGLLCTASIGQRPFAVCVSKEGAMEDECMKWSDTSEMRDAFFYFKANADGSIDNQRRPMIDNSSGWPVDSGSGGAYCHFFNHCAA